MFGDLLRSAESMLGNADPGDVRDAATEHVDSMGTNELAGHLIGMIPNLPEGARSGLAGALLGALGRNGKSPDALEDAGVPAGDAQNGQPEAVTQLLQHATSDPSSLKDAAVSYITSHPQLVAQYAPQLLQGVLGRLKG